MISHQPLKNKLKKNRVSAYMLAMKSKHKATGAHKPKPIQKHPQVQGRGKGSMGRY